MKDAKGHGSDPHGAHSEGVQKAVGRRMLNAHFSAESGRGRTDIYDAKTGEYLTQLRNKEVAGWVHHATRSIEQEAAYAPQRQAQRLANVRGYLAKRAARPKETQLTLL